jgi:hypothetical protein
MQARKKHQVIWKTNVALANISAFRGEYHFLPPLGLAFLEAVFDREGIISGSLIC